MPNEEIKKRIEGKRIIAMKGTKQYKKREKQFQNQQIKMKVKKHTSKKKTKVKKII